MNDQPVIGVAGLGIMGLPMARHLRGAGFDVHVFNRSPKPLAAACTFGAVPVDSPRELVEACDTIITMLPTPTVVRTFLGGPFGFITAPKKEITWIQMSTLDIVSTMEFAQRAQEQGWAFIDCPVTGSKKQVEAAQLILLAGAAAQDLERVRPVLSALGKTIVHAGPVGSGTALKLCMNLIVAQMTTGLAEATALASALSIDAAHIWNVIKASPALDCGYFRIKEEAILNKDFTPAFSLANMLKDTRFMLAEAKRHHQSLPVTEAVAALLQKSRRQRRL